MLKSTKGCRLRATDKNVMRAVESTGLTTGRISPVAVAGKRNEFSLTRKPLPAYKRTAGRKNGRTLSPAQARAERMRGK